MVLQIAGGIILALFMLVSPASAARPVRVRGAVRNSGTYVAPHVRTSPNKTQVDNYSTKGNVNPMTGKVGTKAATK